MKATEIIQLAIVKLEDQRAEAAAGPWGIGPGEDYLVSTASGSSFGSPGAWIMGEAIGRDDIDLIVTLHRTIDAQLAILREGLRWVSDDRTSSFAFLEAATTLARAILGEATA